MNAAKEFPSWWMYHPQGYVNHGKDSDFDQKIEAVPPWIREIEHPEKAINQNGDGQVEDNVRGKTFYLDPAQDELALTRINMALYLRKPMLVRGDPGVGKSSLAYSLAHCLGLGKVIRWPITSHSTLKEGLYYYDAIGDLSQVVDDNIRTPTFSLGPLGRAISRRSNLPAVLLIDEIDKSDMDLPNNLLHFLEDASFQIQELSVQNQSEDANGQTVKKIPYKVLGVKFDGKTDDGICVDEYNRIPCVRFPIIVMTSNQERPLPPAFLRRCITVEFKKPGKEKIENIIKLRFQEEERYSKEKIDNTVLSYIYDKIQVGNLSADFALQAIALFLSAERPKNQDLYGLINELSTALDYGNGK